MSEQPNLIQIMQQVGHYLTVQQMKVCTAESCTGGYLAQLLTALPGSSVWFDCGIVTYSNAAKQKLLNVPEDILLKHGAVSEAVAISMAQGALAVSSADLAIAITGIAGPGGATADKPVGTVWFAWHMREYETITRYEHFSGDREAVRQQAVATALSMILQIPLD